MIVEDVPIDFVKFFQNQKNYLLLLHEFLLLKFSKSMLKKGMGLSLTTQFSLRPES